MGCLECKFCDKSGCEVICEICGDHYICKYCLELYKNNLQNYINDNKLHEKVKHRITDNYLLLNDDDGDYICKKCVMDIVMSRSDLYFD